MEDDGPGIAQADLLHVLEPFVTTKTGHLGMGAGIGAAAGAVAGLAGVFGSRGPDVVIPQGTTMEMVLDRELRFTAAELSGRNQ